MRRVARDVARSTMMLLMDVEWLSVPEVARRLNKDARTVRRRWIAPGELVAYELDGRTLSVKASDFEAFIEKRRVCPGDAAGRAAGCDRDLLQAG